MTSTARLIPRIQKCRHLHSFQSSLISSRKAPTTRIPRTSITSTRPYSSSTDASSAADTVLASLRTDLKTAMKSRNTTQSAVIRNLLNDVSSLEKSSPSTPITPTQFLSLLQKRIDASHAAAEQFLEAKRSDLAEKETEQQEVMKDYLQRFQDQAGGVVGKEEIRNCVDEIVLELRSGAGQIKSGEVLKRLLGKGGTLEGRVVNKADIATIVNKAVTGT